MFFSIFTFFFSCVAYSFGLLLLFFRKTALIPSCSALGPGNTTEKNIFHNIYFNCFFTLQITCNSQIWKICFHSKVQVCIQQSENIFLVPGINWILALLRPHFIDLLLFQDFIKHKCTILFTRLRHKRDHL